MAFHHRRDPPGHFGLNLGLGLRRRQAGSAEYVANPVRADGSNDWMRRNADLTGSADSKLLTFSVWARYDASQAMHIAFLGPNNAQEGFRISSNLGEIIVAGRNSSNTEIVRFEINTTINDNNWHHIMGSFDLNSTLTRGFYVDNTDAETPGTWSPYTDAEMDLTRSNHFILSRNAGTTKYSGDLADLQIWFGIYTDFSVQANRELFIKDGKPINPDTAAATLGTPIIRLSGPTSGWETNKGSGGGFELVGALSDPTPGTGPVEL